MAAIQICMKIKNLLSSYRAGAHSILVTIDVSTLSVLFHSIKGTVRPDWICMRVVPLDRPLKGHQLLYGFDFLISVLNI